MQYEGVRLPREAAGGEVFPQLNASAVEILEAGFIKYVRGGN